MTLLELLKQFAQRTGIPIPVTVIGNQDRQVIQLLALLNEVVEDLTDRPFTELTREAVFTTVAAESQGALSTIAPSGFQSVINDTIFNRTLRLPIFGPMAAKQWQAFKTMQITGPASQYRIVRGELLFMPVPAAGHTCAFEYLSNMAILGADLSPKSAFTADTDTFILPARLPLAGLRWKWKYEQGLDYAEDFRRYEELVSTYTARDGTKPTVDLSMSGGSATPGIIVPSGSWNL